MPEPAQLEVRPRQDVERVPLVRLAARADGLASGALTRVVPPVDRGRGPARVSVAAFQSSV